LQTLRMRHMRQQNLWKKAFEITIATKEPLTSHVHHAKIQNRCNTNLDVYSIFGFFCTVK
jgi:hypothetical protein